MATSLSVGRVVYKKGLAKEDKIGASQMYGAYGVFGGGQNTTPAYTNTIDYITISTPGDATDFGELTQGRENPAATSDGSRGVFGGGLNPAFTPNYLNTIDYITISTPGDATVFGALTEGRFNLAATSDGSRGVFGGGNDGASTPARRSTIDYITIANDGTNATDFGELTQGRYGLTATSDGSRGVFGGGNNTDFAPAYLNTIDYITIATPSDATDFGDLTQGRAFLGATSDGSRGVFGGGYGPTPTLTNVDTIDYITIATPSDATDFGGLTVSRRILPATSDGSRGVWGGGYSTSTTNTIDYITIATPSDATAFGELTERRYGSGATSGD